MRFRFDTQGLAPVVGTILVIAISIVLAGGLFFMSKYIAAPPEKAPKVTFSWNELNDDLQVVTADPDLMRSDYQIQLSVPGDFEFIAEVAPGTDALGALQFVPLGGASGGPTDAPLKAGESIALCSAPAAQDVDVAVRHIQSRTMIYRVHVASLQACPA